MIPLFVTAAVAFTVPGFVLAVRALPWVSRKVDAGIKPWACDVCMSFWGTALFSVLASTVTREPLHLLAAGPAYTIALLILARLEAPPIPLPPELAPGLAEALEPPKETP